MILTFRTLAPPGTSVRRDAPVGAPRGGMPGNRATIVPLAGRARPLRAALPRPGWSCDLVDGRLVWSVRFDTVSGRTGEDA